MIQGEHPIGQTSGCQSDIIGQVLLAIAERVRQAAKAFHATDGILNHYPDLTHLPILFFLFIRQAWLRIGLRFAGFLVGDVDLQCVVVLLDAQAPTRQRN